MKPINSKSGFTLIESLISIIVLAIVIMAGMKLFFVTDEIKTLAMHRKIATEIANSELEDIKRMPYANVVADGPNTIKIGDLTASASDGLGVEIFVQEISDDFFLTGVPITYKIVDVSVSWKEVNQNGTQEVKFTTFKPSE